MSQGARHRVSLLKTKPDTTIIVPVLNESDNVRPLVQRINKAIPRHKTQILFVDDSPNNKTVRAVNQAQKKNRRKTLDIDIYHRRSNYRTGGLSGAVAAGLKRAKSDQIIVMDGDLQHPPEILKSMLLAVSSADIVIASRYCKGGSSSGLNGITRHFVSLATTLITKSLFPLRLHKISDPMTGYFLINRKHIDVKRLHPKGFKILLEILARYPKLSVSEVPLQFADRNAGVTTASLKQGTEFLGQLANLRLRKPLYIFNRLPKFIRFGAIGGFVFGLGMIMLFVMIDALGMPPLLAYAIQLAITFWLNYVLNRNITWHDRTVNKLAAHKFIISRALTTVLNYFLFAWLITLQYSFFILGYTINSPINYLLANFICLLVILTINYVMTDRWAFAESKREPVNFLRLFGRILKQIPFNLILLGLTLGFIGIAFINNPKLSLTMFLAISSLILFVQSSIEVWRMVYSFREPESSDRLRFPKARVARESFCLIVPARHESDVLADTLHQLAKQTHPNVKIITVICDDDFATLNVARKAASIIPRVKVMSYPLKSDKPSKPKQLNYVFNKIKNQGYSIIGVIDAEDTVQPELLMHIEAAFRDRSTGIVQGGVQLINHDSSWYSLHNVLEYYRWFNSTMAFQADNKFMPLGGNTIFIRTGLLKSAGGWPVTLTEDCSLGVLLSSRFNTKTAVYYEPELATLEETPNSLKDLFRQRVRWNQGFYHEWRKGVWKELPTLRQRILAEYVLMGSVIMAIISVLVPLSLIAFLFLDAPVGLVMLMYLPLIPASLNVALSIILLHDFGKAFGRSVLFRQYLMLFITQIAYQFVLSAAAFWAIIRELRGNYTWDKTAHTGKHRIGQVYVAGDSTGLTLVEEGGDAE